MSLWRRITMLFCHKPPPAIALTVALHDQEIQKRQSMDRMEAVRHEQIKAAARRNSATSESMLRMAQRSVEGSSAATQVVQDVLDSIAERNRRVG